MGLVFRLIELFWLILPIAGVIIAGWRAWSAYERRRAGQVAEAPARIGNDVAYKREISRAIDAHNRTDRRWLDYEMDVAKLLDFPMMTEMREPLTVRFHKAKLRAEMLRPATVEDLPRRPRCPSGVPGSCPALRNGLRCRRDRSNPQTAQRLFRRG